MKRVLVLILLSVSFIVAGIFVGCSNDRSTQGGEAVQQAAEINTNNLRDIYFAGGCFWGVEEYFSRVPGVYNVTSGYANGNTENPSYGDVCYRDTGHAETVHVQYDPSIISLTTLTEQFFKIIDPTSLNRQGFDVGSQYRTGVYYTNEADLEIIKTVFDKVQQNYSEQIVTELLPLEHFYLAEEYHQDYLVKNPFTYCHIDFSTLDDIVTEDKKEAKTEHSGDGSFCVLTDDEIPPEKTRTQKEPSPLCNRPRCVPSGWLSGHFFG